MFVCLCVYNICVWACACDKSRVGRFAASTVAQSTPQAPFHPSIHPPSRPPAHPTPPTHTHQIRGHLAGAGPAAPAPSLRRPARRPAGHPSPILLGAAAAPEPPRGRLPPHRRPWRRRPCWPPAWIDLIRSVPLLFRSQRPLWSASLGPVVSCVCMSNQSRGPTQ